MHPGTIEQGWRGIFRFLRGSLPVLALAAGAALTAETARADEPVPVAANVLGKSRDKMFFANERFFVRNWAVLGPFYFNPDTLRRRPMGAMIDVAFVADETKLEPEEGREAGDGCAWLLYKPASRPEMVDLDAFYNGPNYAAAYAVAHVFSEDDVPNALLMCGSDDFIKVWLNGELAHTYNEKRRAMRADEDRAIVNLKKGWNKVVVKCVDIRDGWSFSLRFAPPLKEGSSVAGGFQVECEKPEPKLKYADTLMPARPGPGQFKDAIDLAGEWLVKADVEGVSAEQQWQKTGLDTRDWKKMTVPGAFDDAVGVKVKGKLCPPFENEKLDSDWLYNGIAWLRKTVRVPASWKGSRIVLELGGIDDMDVAYFNGHQAGYTDKTTNPDDFWKTPRTYEIDPEWVKFDADNEIAVMALDNHHAGGIMGPVVRLVCRAPPRTGQVAGVIDLAGTWLLKADIEGVSAEQQWQKPDLDVKDWKNTTVPGEFDADIGLEQKGRLCAPFADETMTDTTLYNGIAWLRRKVRVPADWKGKCVLLELGRVDDMDVAYVNGKQVGYTNRTTNPDDFWSAARSYEIDESNIKFGADNDIAVMVLDNNNIGGILGPAVRLVCREKK